MKEKEKILRRETEEVEEVKQEVEEESGEGQQKNTELYQQYDNSQPPPDNVRPNQVQPDMLHSKNGKGWNMKPTSNPYKGSSGLG